MNQTLEEKHKIIYQLKAAGFDLMRQLEAVNRKIADLTNDIAEMESYKKPASDDQTEASED